MGETVYKFSCPVCREGDGKGLSPKRGAMHRFNVSAEVFSKLWALRRDAEQTEDQILRRLLDCPPEAAAGGALANGLAQGPDNISGGDFIDATYGVRFAEGFEIFRTYKGRPYTASVVRGRWLLDDDGDGNTGPYDSLNQLSQAVIDGNENAWIFWFTRRPDGTEKRIAELRDPALVQKRPRRKRRRGWVAQPKATPPGGAPKESPSPAALSTPSVSQAAFQAAPSRKPPSTPPSTTPARPGGGRAWEPVGPEKRD